MILLVFRLHVYIIDCANILRVYFVQYAVLSVIEDVYTMYWRSSKGLNLILFQYLILLQ